MFDRTIKFIEKFIFSFWWVILFILLCFVLLEQGIKERDQEFFKLNEHLKFLQQERETAIALQEDLLLQVNSQSDPAWVELLLMKGLGVVPEGQKKVFFSPKQVKK
jgi:hypothetical protein